jgi:hypothetical protein
MPSRLRAALLSLVPLVLVAAACVSRAHARTPSPARDGRDSDSTVAPGSPSITILSPTPGQAVQGVAIIRFRTEHVRIESPFLPVEQHRGPLPAGHVHVTVDGTSWHWVHATSDPVVVTPLPPGEHTVALELAGADHRPLDARAVRFTVVARTAPATKHAGHP